MVIMHTYGMSPISSNRVFMGLCVDMFLKMNLNECNKSIIYLVMRAITGVNEQPERCYNQFFLGNIVQRCCSLCKEV